MHHISGGELYDGLADLREEKQKIASLIDLYSGNLNAIGEKESALSKRWCSNNMQTGKTKTALLNAGNFLRHKCGASVDEAMWTCYDEFRRKIGVNGYAGGFCPCNARATNNYRHRDSVAYIVNVYDNPYIVQWFHDYGISVNQDALALSQMLQWIWRSAIRDGNPIQLFVPSMRMRTLFTGWLEDGLAK